VRNDSPLLHRGEDRFTFFWGQIYGFRRVFFIPAFTFFKQLSQFFYTRTFRLAQQNVHRRCSFLARLAPAPRWCKSAGHMAEPKNEVQITTGRERFPGFEGSGHHQGQFLSSGVSSCGPASLPVSDPTNPTRGAFPSVFWSGSLVGLLV